jgi:hypothetical protein
MNVAARLCVAILVLAVTGAFVPRAHPQSNGGVRFTDVTAVAGVALPGLTTESVAWGDFDNDGDDRFTDVTVAAGVGSIAFSVGAAFGDLDNDIDGRRALSDPGLPPTIPAP